MVGRKERLGARVQIERQLTDGCSAVQDRKALNLFAGRGVAVREVIMAKSHGPR